jgi:hypothetical protein
MEMTKVFHTSRTLSCRMNCVTHRSALSGATAAFPQQWTVGVEALPTGLEIGRNSSVTSITWIGIGVC